MNECPECRKKHRDPDELKALQNRLNRIEGQVRGINRQLTDEVYCIDILNQVSAAQAALTAFSKELLQSHIRSCVSDGIKRGDDEVVEELIATIQKMIK